MKSIYSLWMVLFLSASVANAADNPTPKFKGKPLTYWIERLEKAETDTEQSEAAQAIIAFKTDAAPVVPKLIEMLDDRSDGFRSLIYRILGQIGSAAKPAIPKLVELLKEKSDDEFSTIFETLQAIGSDAKDVVPALIESLRKPVLAESAIKSLYRIGPAAKEAIPAIRTAVQDAKSRWSKGKYDHGDVRSADEYLLTHRYWLGELYKLGPDAIPVLIEFLQTGTTDDRFYAANALGKIKPAVKQATPILRKLLHSKESSVRLSAAHALWRIEKDKSIVPVLISLVEEGWEIAVRLLGEIGPDAKAAIPVLKTLTERYKDSPFIEHSKLRIAAQDAINKIDVVGTPKTE